MFRNEREGLADEGARERMRLLVPHLRRAVLIGKLVEFKTAQAATFADALDGLSASVLFVDSSGRITHANAAGRAMIADGDVLRGSHGRLVANDPEVNRSLRDIFLAADTGDAATSLPSFIAKSAIGACHSHGVATITRSISLSLSIRSKS